MNGAAPDNCEYNTRIVLLTLSNQIVRWVGSVIRIREWNIKTKPGDALSLRTPAGSVEEPEQVARISERSMVTVSTD
jgi:hypothetical protein